MPCGGRLQVETSLMKASMTDLCPIRVIPQDQSRPARDPKRHSVHSRFAQAVIHSLLTKMAGCFERDGRLISED
jgi:hypothetical protein